MESSNYTEIVGQKSDKTVIDIEYLLRKLCFKIRQKGREILEDYHVTPPQFDALQLLTYEGDMTVSELSSRLYLAPSTITDLIDRMEKNEHVIRVRDTKDRRIVKIMVQEKGKILISEVIERRCAFIETLLQEVEESERQQFLDYLTILERAALSQG